jgi:predicted component of type VI protein secretion system
MSKENYLSRIEDEESSAGMEGLSQNKTLYVDQFTTDVTHENRGLAMEEVEENGQKRGVYPKTMKEVFAYFKPKVEIDFSGDGGETKKEILNFKEMKDFEMNNGKGNLITNSSFLSDLRNKKENCENVQKQIEKNARLRDILKDSEARGELKALLESILVELNNG